MINEISLSAVADDFIGYINNLTDFPVYESADFILIASTLVLIKSRSLLPSIELTDEEKGNIKDLERRLALLKRLKELSNGLSRLFGERVIFPEGERPRPPVFAPDASVTIAAIAAAVRSALLELPKKEFIPRAVVRKVITLEQMIENLTERVKRGLRVGFKEFSKIGREEKVNVIVGFLAVLELVKRGIISVTQGNRFEDIAIETGEVEVPRY